MESTRHIYTAALLTVFSRSLGCLLDRRSQVIGTIMSPNMTNQMQTLFVLEIYGVGTLTPP
jgi:hypothetical protein